MESKLWIKLSALLPLLVLPILASHGKNVLIDLNCHCYTTYLQCGGTMCVQLATTAHFHLLRLLLSFVFFFFRSLLCMTHTVLQHSRYNLIRYFQNR